MKISRSTLTKQSKQGPSKKPRPEIRDDMDSRHVKESKKGDATNPANTKKAAPKKK